jgi:hypothetical protein
VDYQILKSSKINRKKRFCGIKNVINNVVELPEMEDESDDYICGSFQEEEEGEDVLNSRDQDIDVNCKILF